MNHVEYCTIPDTHTALPDIFRSKRRKVALLHTCCLLFGEVVSIGANRGARRLQNVDPLIS